MNKNIKEPKVVKTYTKKQIAKAAAFMASLLVAGAFIGVVIDRAITSTIDARVDEIVKTRSL